MIKETSPAPSVQTLKRFDDQDGYASKTEHILPDSDSQGENQKEFEQSQETDQAKSKRKMWWKEEMKPTSSKLNCEIITPNDSRDPSYTNLTLPYRVICHQRYRRCVRKYRKQFIKEIQRQEVMQFRALDGIRIKREFCDPLIEPLRPEDRIKLTPKQQFKLDQLLKAEKKVL